MDALEGPLDLTGARALVTGAGTRVGRAIATTLGAAGLDVAVHYYTNERGALEVRDEIAARGGRAAMLRADLADRQQAQALVEDAVAVLGGLDLLVVNAANFDRTPWETLDESAWDRALALNLSSAFVLCRQAAPHLRLGRGSIVLITCVSTHTPFRNYLPYVVSKGALQHLMRCLALELAPGVRVNAVAPGTVLPPEAIPTATLERLRQLAPLGRTGTASDVASAVLFLAQAPFVTGQELVVDGGRSLGQGVG